MTATALSRKSEAVAFDRLHALVDRGYRPVFGGSQSDGVFSRIELRHPKTKGDAGPPPVTLWSNGIVSTTAILWPRQYVPSREGVPVWQKFIASEDGPCFAHFLADIPRPGLYDRHFASPLQKTRALAMTALFSTAACGSLPVIAKILPLAFGGAA